MELRLTNGAGTVKIKDAVAGPPNMGYVIHGDVPYWTFATATDKAIHKTILLTNTIYLRIYNTSTTNAYDVWVQIEVLK
jgi:hypothetical protein